MKTLFTYSTLLRSFGLLIVALTLNSCGAFYPYAYYYSGYGGNNEYAYREHAPKQSKNYSVYFSDKANEYSDILGEDVVVVEERINDNNANKQVNVNLVIDTSPYYGGYYSWGFRPYWDIYYAYSPYVNYGYYNSPYFYDQWYWRYSSAYYGWGFNSWWNPYGSYAYYYPYHHNHYLNSPSINRGRNNHNRSSYRSSRILGYNSYTSNSPSRSKVSTLRSLNNTGRSSINSTTRNRGRSSSIDLRSSNDSRLRGYQMPSRSSNTINRSNTIRTRSYTPSRNSSRYTPQRSTIKRSSTIKQSSSRPNNNSNNNNSSYRRPSSPMRSSSVGISRPSSPRPVSVSRSSSSGSSSSRSSSSSSSVRKRN